MKLKLSLLSTVVCALALLCCGTHAYFSAQQMARVAITTGQLGVAVSLDAAEVTALPGAVVNDTLTVKNTGTQPGWVRARVTLTADDPALEPDECVILNIDEETWTYADGWYYCRAALEPGAAAQTLFTQVRFDAAAMDNRYLGRTLTLDVTAQAVQTANNGESALQARSWPE